MSQSNTQVTQESYLWIIDKDQSDRISEMLETDFEQFGVVGTRVLTPQYKCAKCGKLSGLDDFISGALKSKVHTREFMINALREPSTNLSPPHKLDCCVCGDAFLECNSVAPKSGLAYRVSRAFSLSPYGVEPPWQVPNWQVLAVYAHVEFSYSGLPYSDSTPWEGGAHTPFISIGNSEHLSRWARLAGEEALQELRATLGSEPDPDRFTVGTPQWGETAKKRSLYHSPLKLIERHLTIINENQPPVYPAFSPFLS